VDDCFATGAPSACNLIQRIPTNDGSIGPISRILNQNINADMARTSGVDLEVVYNCEPDLFGSERASFSIRALVGYLTERSPTTPAGTTQDLAGSPTRPTYSGVVTGNYTRGPRGLLLQGRYYHKGMNNTTWVEGRDIDDNRLSSQTAFNSAASYRGEMSRG